MVRRVAPYISELSRFAPELRLSSRLCRGVCLRFAPGLAVLLRGFAFGSRPALRFSRGDWPSVHACLFSLVRKKETACGMLRFYSAGSRSPFARSRGVGAVIGRGGNAELVCGAMRFLSRRLTSVHVRRCGSGGDIAFGVRLPSRLYRGVCLRFTPVFFLLSGKKRRLATSCVPVPPGRDRHSCVLAVSARLSGVAGTRSWFAGRCAFYRGDLPSVHACLFSLVRKKETACDALRSYSAGRDRHSRVLAVSVRLSGVAGTRSWSAGRCAFCRGD